MLPITQRQFSWVTDVVPCPNCSIGTSSNEEFNNYGSSQIRKNEDRSYSGAQYNVQLCMVLDGHDGENAVEYAQMNIAGHLLSREIVGGPKEVADTIRRAFIETEQNFFLMMDDPIGRRLALKAEISQRAQTSYDASKIFPQQVAELGRLDVQIKGGTTVVLSLVCNNQLYIANVGDSRALLCQEIDGKIIASQLSDDHNVFNPKEQERLERIGINRDMLLSYRRLGPFQVTRSIGDYSIKGGYREVDVLRIAKEEPGSCIPFINGPWDIARLNRTFVILMSDGLYEAYATCTQIRNPSELHNALAALVVEEMKYYKHMDRVAQAVVNRVKAEYKEFHQKNSRSGRLDDISLIVQNFSYDVVPLVREKPPLPPRTPTNPEGVFIAEPMTSPPAVDRLAKDVATKMNFNDYTDSNDPSKPLVEDRPSVVLTQEQIDSGNYITPYVSFPSNFPFDLGLDDL